MDTVKSVQQREEECRIVVEDILKNNRCNLQVKMLCQVGSMVIDAMPALMQEGFVPQFVFKAIAEEEASDEVSEDEIQME